jgi:rfaE bifunctional protein nucleotidyltransferase chain/domain
MPTSPAWRGPDGRKIVALPELLTLRESLRARGQTLVHAHGCFDLIHPGHVRHLRQAKALGDCLLVSITGDECMRKGDARPLFPQEVRAESLAALDCVDLVLIHDAPTAEGLLRSLRPDVYVKGREYELNDDPRFLAERAAVEAGGGRVIFTSGEMVFSSTSLIAALERSAEPYQAKIAALIAQPDLSTASLASLLNSIRGRRVIVVGEVIRDTYILCDQPDVSGESPVLSLRPLETRHYDGGAAILAGHAAALGARTTLVTALPPTPEAAHLRRRLEHEGIEVRDIEVDTPLPEKQRFLVGSQKVVKVDLVRPFVLDESQHESLRNLARDAARDTGGADVVYIADYALSLLTMRSLAELCRAVRPAARVLAGDVSGRRASLLAFRDADLICPAEDELRNAMHLHTEGLGMVAWRFMEETRTRAMIVTLAGEGAVAFSPRPDAALSPDAWRRRLDALHVPALAPVAIDPLGCGDALGMVAALALACGASLPQGVFLGSCAAGVQVQRLGNYPVTPSDLRTFVSRLHASRLAWAGVEVLPRTRVAL